ncbi:TAXI family TRAP transporter solute-binding subunit [Thalassoroseus pseudoceratinae]|uniref:TAXI family TRAP transporter solute-binding subunit n=1 Tax=Thalassoroseus pseudoceratinae TaxID=2713176 RepID=UPI00142240AF|nr:TAXI family TRAP transporter solute-binding subunit [Thalassoroseus pseudoceratinae]
MWAFVALLTIGGFAVAWHFVEPAPPSQIVIAAGPKDGAYYQVAQKYSKFFAENGIELTVLETAGSIENYDLLLADNDVNLAFAQGGTSPPAEAGQHRLEGLASVYLEPFWVFTLGHHVETDLRSLAGKRIAIGPVGSGTAPLARLMLRENGITDELPTELVSIGGSEAATQLRSGDVDAAIFVGSPQSQVIGDLLTDPEVRLLSLARHEAYAFRYPFLANVKISRGVIDLANDIPNQDAHLVAPAAMLVCTEEFHDAFVPMLLQAARKVNATAGVTVSREEFPSRLYLEHDLNESARQFLKSGPPILQRFLPFWVASAVERGKLFLLPFVALFLPLLKLTPPIYRWRIRSRIYGWYEVLRKIDQYAGPDADPDVLKSHLETLNEMEKELESARSVPLSYMQEFYNLRLHIEFVERRIQAELKSMRPAKPTLVPSATDAV